MIEDTARAADLAAVAILTAAADPNDQYLLETLTEEVATTDPVHRMLVALLLLECAAMTSADTLGPWSGKVPGNLLSRLRAHDRSAVRSLLRANVGIAEPPDAAQTLEDIADMVYDLAADPEQLADRLRTWGLEALTNPAGQRTHTWLD